MKADSAALALRRRVPAHEAGIAPRDQGDSAIDVESGRVDVSHAAR